MTKTPGESLPPAKAGVEALILQGGKGSRLGGVDKSRLEYRGERFVDHLITLLAPRVSRIRLSVADQDAAPDGALELVIDEFPGAGPLAGIAAGLASARADWSFVVACDLPLLSAPLLDLAWVVHGSWFAVHGEDSSPDHEPRTANHEPQTLVVIPRRGDRWEPLCAFYHRSLAASARAALCDGRFSVHQWLKTLPEASLKLWELPQALEKALSNVNTPEDYRALSETD